MDEAATAALRADNAALDARCAANPREATNFAALLRRTPHTQKVTWLWNSALLNNATLVRLQLADGLSPRIIYPEYANSSVLHAATEQGAIEVVRLLLEAGADANCCDYAGNSPLANAIGYSQLDCVRELIPHTDLRTFMYSAIGGNVLHDSIFANQPEIFKLLLPHFADNIDICTIKGRPPAPTGGPYNITPLHLACHGGHHAMVKALLAAGASRTAHDSNSFSCLHSAAHGGHLACVTLLIGRPENQKMSPAEIDIRDSKERTPLFMAAMNGHRYCCAALLAASADPAIAAINGRTALDVAKHFHPGNQELIELLECRGGGPAPLLCAGCGASDKRLHACTACQSASFCSDACMAQFWPVHMAECMRIQAANEEQTRTWRALRWPCVGVRLAAESVDKAAVDAAAKQLLATAATEAVAKAAAERQRFADAQAAADAAMAELLAEEAASSASAAAAKAKSAKAKAKKKVKAKGGAGPSGAAEEPQDEPQDEPAAPVPAPAAALAQPLAAPPQQPQLRDVPPSPAPAPPPAAQQLAAPSFESLFPWLVVPEAPRPALVPLDAPHEDDLLCVCCLDAPRDTALAGCAGVHADAVCSDCAALLLSRPLPSCPLCRASC